MLKINASCLAEEKSKTKHNRSEENQIIMLPSPPQLANRNNRPLRTLPISQRPSSTRTTPLANNKRIPPRPTLPSSSSNRPLRNLPLPMIPRRPRALNIHHPPLPLVHILDPLRFLESSRPVRSGCLFRDGVRDGSVLGLSGARPPFACEEGRGEEVCVGERGEGRGLFFGFRFLCGCDGR